MKIGLYSPYIPKHFGGGEKYFFDVATTLLQKHDVFVLVPDVTEAQKQIKKYEKFLGYSLEGLKWQKSILNTSQKFLNKLQWTRQFDVLYYITDGSLFFSLAKKNILHIQVPLLLDKSSLIEKLKLTNWGTKNTNSSFTKKVIEECWSTRIEVVHHPKIAIEELEISSAEVRTKRKILLHVGRFFRQLHSKRQDVLLDIYKQLPLQLQQEWKLVFIGEVEDKEYFNELKKAAQGLPVEFYQGISRRELVSWYQKASLYWHATGYNTDQWQHPERVEHFGITTVEAMAAGCVPIVINKGGQPEILGAELEPLLWETSEECLSITEKMMRDEKLRLSIAQQAMKRAHKFGAETFERKLWQMIEG